MGDSFANEEADSSPTLKVFSSLKQSAGGGGGGGGVGFLSGWASEQMHKRSHFGHFLDTQLGDLI